MYEINSRNHRKPYSCKNITNKLHNGKSSRQNVSENNKKDSMKIISYQKLFHIMQMRNREINENWNWKRYKKQYTEKISLEGRKKYRFLRISQCNISVANVYVGTKEKTLEGKTAIKTNKNSISL